MASNKSTMSNILLPERTTFVWEASNWSLGRLGFRKERPSFWGCDSSISPFNATFQLAIDKIKECQCQILTWDWPGQGSNWSLNHKKRANPSGLALSAFCVRQGSFLSCGRSLTFSSSQIWVFLYSQLTAFYLVSSPLKIPQSEP